MMNTLYPIIRRKRRPLIVADKPPVVAGNVEPVIAVATKPVEPVVAENETKASDAKATPELDA
jgi:hypothetical protein